MENSCAKIILAKDGDATSSHLLRLRIPDLTTTAGVRLRDLSGGAEWVEIALEGFVYGREELVAALCPAQSAAEARARWQIDREFWPAVEPWRAEAQVLAKAVECSRTRRHVGLPSCPNRRRAPRKKQSLHSDRSVCGSYGERRSRRGMTAAT